MNIDSAGLATLGMLITDDKAEHSISLKTYRANVVNGIAIGMFFSQHKHHITEGCLQRSVTRNLPFKSVFRFGLTSNLL